MSSVPSATREAKISPAPDGRINLQMIIPMVGMQQVGTCHRCVHQASSEGRAVRLSSTSGEYEPPVGTVNGIRQIDVRQRKGKVVRTVEHCKSESIVREATSRCVFELLRERRGGESVAMASWALYPLPRPEDGGIRRAHSPVVLSR